MFKCIAYAEKKRKKKYFVVFLFYIRYIYVWLGSMLAVFTHGRFFVIVYVQSDARTASCIGKKEKEKKKKVESEFVGCVISHKTTGTL